MTERPILFSGPMVRAILENRKSQTRRVVKPQPPQCYDFEECHRAKDGKMVYVFKGKHLGGANGIDCQYEIGQKLWVRETWRPTWSSWHTPTGKPGHSNIGIDYRAGGSKSFKFIGEPPRLPGDSKPDRDVDGNANWRPSIFMPHWASRITLDLNGVRVERLQEISSNDAQAEGFWLFYIENGLARGCRPAFRDYWDSINAKPKPIYVNRKIVSYVSYPWEDIRETRTHRGRPWQVIGNPCVWCLEFARVKA